MKTLCPHCSQHYEIDDTYLGYTIQCPKCEKYFVVELRKEVCVAENTPRANLTNGSQPTPKSNNPVKSKATSKAPKKGKTIYFICPNPNCGYEGDITIDPEAGMLGTLCTMLLLGLAGIGTIITDKTTVSCPRCGMKVDRQI